MTREKRPARRGGGEGQDHVPCRADLFEIGAWIERDNPQRAVSFVEELYDACQRLGQMARAFPLLPGHEDTGIRRYPHKRDLIFYVILEGPRVEVLRILHGHRNYKAVLFPYG